MILTDREIRISLEKKLIEIDPAPGADAFSSTAVDLTLDAPFRFYKNRSKSLDHIVDPARDGFDITDAIHDLTEQRQIDAGGFALEPGNLILAWTKESVNLKTESRVAARVEGKSSLARLGILVHLTAPTIHAGFSRPIQLEVINLGKVPVRLRVGMRICQLILEQTLGVADQGYAGRFAKQGAASL